MPTKNQTRDFIRKVRIEHDARISDSLDNIEYELPTASTDELGGVKVGDGLTINNDGTLNVTIESYTLPTASATTKGGVKVGSGLTMNGDSICAETYTLPTASATVKGGVKVGSGLSMDGETLSANLTADNLPTASTTSGGIMSAADKAKLDSLNNYTLPTASATVKGGVKVGAGLSMDGETLSANLTADNLPTASSTSGGIMSAADKAKLDSLNNYTLPTASTTTKGGVKVGSGLSMNGETLSANLTADNLPTASSTSGGIMSAADKAKLDSLNNYTLPTASQTVKGGVKVGAGLSMNGETLTVDTDAVAQAVELPTASKTVKGGIKIGSGLYMHQDSLMATGGAGEIIVIPASEKTTPKEAIADVASVQGGLWAEEIDNTPYLRLRYGWHVYNFLYDTAVVTGQPSSGYEPPSSIEGLQTCVLGQTSLDSDGALWYEFSNITDPPAPVIAYHYGNANFKIKHDSITWVGNRIGLSHWLPFESSDVTTDIAFYGADANRFSIVSAASLGIVTTTGLPSGFSDYCLQATDVSYLRALAVTCPAITQKDEWFTRDNGVDFWFKAGTTSATRMYGFGSQATIATGTNYITTWLSGDNTVVRQTDGGNTTTFTVTIPGAGWHHFYKASWYDANTQKYYRMTAVDGQPLWTKNETVAATAAAGNNWQAIGSIVKGGAVQIKLFRSWHTGVPWFDTFTPPVADDYIYP